MNVNKNFNCPKGHEDLARVTWNVPEARLKILTILCYNISMDNVKILAIVGMSGSGKSVVVDYLTAKGYPKVYFGGMIISELKKRGFAITPEAEKKVIAECKIRTPDLGGKSSTMEVTKAIIKELI